MLFNNLILVSWDGKITAYGYDAAGQLVRQTEYGQSNNEGRLKDRPETWHIHRFKRNILGQLIEKQSRKVSHKNGQSKDEGISRTHFVWDGTRLLQEYTYKGSYTYIYTDQDSYEPLAQVFQNNQDETQYLAYFHTDQIGILREMTDIHGNLLWYGEYTAWGRLKKDERIYQNAHQPFRLQNQYFDEETGLHYNLMRYLFIKKGRVFTRPYVFSDGLKIEAINLFCVCRQSCR